MNYRNRFPQTILVLGGYAESLLNFRGALLKEMVALGYRVIACAPESDRGVEGKLRGMGVEYYSVPFSRGGLNPLGDVPGIWALAKILLRVTPDFILSYTIKPVIYGSLMAGLFRIKHIFSMVTGLGYAFTPGRSLKRRIIGKLATVLYRLALHFNQGVFFQNPDDRDFFQGRRILNPRNRVFLINGSGVDLDHFCESPLPSPSFLLIARLIGDKGIREYVQAARILKKKYKNLCFFLVGWMDKDNPDGIIAKELEAWVGEGNIEYLGALSDVRPAIQNTAIYVLPSYREGTPRTVLEAMAMGRPIITTDAPGCRETVVNGENGYLVPVRDGMALAGAMERFLSCPSLIESMGQKSRRMAEKKYDVRKVNASILKGMGLDD